MPLESFRNPLTLHGRWVDLVPLAPEHSEPLTAAAQDPEIGRFLFGPPGRTVAEMDRVIEHLLTAQSAGTDLAFTQVLRSSGAPVGMTRFLRIERENRKVEIGGTWLDPRWWRTPVNTEGKFLLLRHAFETEQVHRVVIQTDLRNERSQRAIARLGASREGVLREDRLLPSGRFRSSVIYSVLADEWPRVKERLERLLARPWPATARPTTTSGDV